MATINDVILQQAEQFLVEAIKAGFEGDADAIDLRPGTPQYDLFVRPQLPVLARVIAKLNDADRKATPLNFDQLTQTELFAIGDRWQVNPTTGRKAGGSVRIKLKERVAVSVSPADEIVQNGLVYHPTAVVDLAASDLSFESVLDYYYADVQIESDDVGSKYITGIDTKFTMAAYDGDTNLIEIVAVTPISGGFDVEANADYYQRIRTTSVVRNLINNLSINNVLKDQFAGSIQRLLVVGYQDAEMRRDLKTVVDPLLGNISLHLGGHTDIYVKTPIIRKTVEIFVPSGGFEIDMSAYLALLKVHSVTRKSDPTTPLYFALTNTRVDTRYSARDGVRLFVDPGVVNDTIVVDMSYAPDVVEIQAFVDSEDQHVTNADQLVRFFHPVWLSSLIYVQGIGTGDSAASAAMEVYLEGLTNAEPLAVSRLTEAIYKSSAVNVVQDYALTAQVYYGDGTQVELTDSNVLVIPDNLAKGFTQRVACYVNEAIRLVPVG
jgi:hypothetical protein